MYHTPKISLDFSLFILFFFPFSLLLDLPTESPRPDRASMKGNPAEIIGLWHLLHRQYAFLKAAPREI